MKVIFFSKWEIFYIDLRNAKKFAKIFFVLVIMSFEAVAGT